MIPIHKRSIVKAILLSIVTLGIYSLYWEYLLVKNTRALKHDNTSCTGEMLCLIFVPFYPLYWWYTRGCLVKKEFSERHYAVSSEGIIYLVLGIFCLSIVSMAIMQNDFNSWPSETQSVAAQDAATVASEEEKAQRVKDWIIIIVGMMILLTPFVAGFITGH